MHEADDYLEEIVEQWTEVHKKSMVTLLILVSLKQKSMWAKEIEQWCCEVSGWEITERGLHRTLKRMHNLGLIEYKEVDAPKTGIKRKVYSLTELGKAFLESINLAPLQYMKKIKFDQ